MGLVVRRLIFGLGIVFIVACSTSKKATVLQQPTVSVIAPKETVVITATKLDTVIPIQQTAQQSQIKDSTTQILSPEGIVWNMMSTGISKQYDNASTEHYDVRKPQYVMIHHTSQASLAQTVRTFQLPHTKVSSHYVIGRDGRVVQILNDYLRGWHAGKGKWGTITDMNSVSIGIELDNSGSEPFPESQINSLMTLLDTLKTRYQIPQKNFIGHSDFAPGRKDDPSIFFPWDKLAQRGFGIWYNPDYLPQPPANFNPIDALKIIGYDTNNLEYTIKAFKKKFIKKDITGVITEYDKAVLYDLYKKYY